MKPGEHPRGPGIPGSDQALSAGMELRLTTAPDDPALLDLPWSLPLSTWPDQHLVVLERGISRHVVRFVQVNERAYQVYAVKEVGERLANHEYRLLRDLERLGLPAVEAVGVVTGRRGADGTELDPALVTRHLAFSLPYRALFSSTLRAETVDRLLDALAVLLVRLHLAGFYWGDCSLSNTLFRRDAGAFAAYLVDAETGELHETLSDGQRRHDIETARVNAFGELLDLEYGGHLHASIDPARTSERIVTRYRELWSEVTRAEQVPAGERHRIESRIRGLNELGFEVAELAIRRRPDHDTLEIRPKVVDAGHHQRRLLRLTGLDVEENQARRLLNDLDTHRAANCSGLPEEAAAHHWLAQVFRPTVETVPAELRAKREPAQFFHEVLDHRWYLSEAAGHDVGLEAAVRSYLEKVLAFRPDEQAVLGGGSDGSDGSVRLAEPVRLDPHGYPEED